MSSFKEAWLDRAKRRAEEKLADAQEREAVHLKRQADQAKIHQHNCATIIAMKDEGYYLRIIYEFLSNGDMGWMMLTRNQRTLIRYCPFCGSRLFNDGTTVICKE
jgi:hypothetical protein